MICVDYQNKSFSRLGSSDSSGRGWPIFQRKSDVTRVSFQSHFVGEKLLGYSKSLISLRGGVAEWLMAPVLKTSHTPFFKAIFYTSFDILNKRIATLNTCNSGYYGFFLLSLKTVTSLAAHKGCLGGSPFMLRGLTGYPYFGGGMKWFKHMADARHDSFVVLLRQKWGREGVCRWWEILEIIASEMNETDKCEARFISGYWTRELGFRSTTDCRSFVEWLAINGRLIVDLSSNEWLVKCPNLLKIRDGRIKNRVQKSPLEVEVDTDTEEEIKDIAVSSKPLPKIPDPRIKKITEQYFVEFQRLYKAKPIWGAKEAALVKRDLKWAEQFGDAQQTIAQGVSKFLLDRSQFIVDQRHPYALFSAQKTKWVISKVPAESKAIELGRKRYEQAKQNSEIVEAMIEQGGIYGNR